MMKIVKKGEEWRRNQFKAMIKRNWIDLSGEDVDNLVQKMRDSFVGSGMGWRPVSDYIPKGWRPKSGEAYYQCVADIENYDYNR